MRTASFLCECGAAVIGSARNWILWDMDRRCMSEREWSSGFWVWNRFGLVIVGWILLVSGLRLTDD